MNDPFIKMSKVKRDINASARTSMQHHIAWLANYKLKIQQTSLAPDGAKTNAKGTDNLEIA